jgi:hypothetical protein
MKMKPIAHSIGVRKSTEPGRREIGLRTSEVMTKRTRSCAIFERPSYLAHVGADERDPEVNFAEKVGIGVPGHLRKPVVPTRKDAEDGGALACVVSRLQ